MCHAVVGGKPGYGRCVHYPKALSWSRLKRFAGADGQPNQIRYRAPQGDFQPQRPIFFICFSQALIRFRLPGHVTLILTA